VRCARCSADADELVTLTRFDPGQTYASEDVCSGCCTHPELVIGSRIDDDPELLAFVLALSDAIDRIGLARGMFPAGL
jgi:hypothetical protein